LEGYFYMEIWFDRTASSSSVFFNRKSLLILVGNNTHFSFAADYDDRRGFDQNRGGQVGTFPDYVAFRQSAIHTYEYPVCSNMNDFYITDINSPNPRLIHKVLGVSRQAT
jgi:hypothetical protein